MPRFRQVCKARCEVHDRADVIVAFEQNDRTGRDTGPQRERSVALGERLAQFGHGFGQILCFNADQHGSIAKPFGDTHAMSGTDLTGDIAEELQRPDRGLITVLLCEMSEAGQVDEPNGSGNPMFVGIPRDECHGMRLPLFVFAAGSEYSPFRAI